MTPAQTQLMQWEPFVFFFRTFASPPTLHKNAGLDVLFGCISLYFVLFLWLFFFVCANASEWVCWVNIRSMYTVTALIDKNQNFFTLTIKKEAKEIYKHSVYYNIWGNRCGKTKAITRRDCLINSRWPDIVSNSDLLWVGSEMFYCVDLRTCSCVFNLASGLQASCFVFFLLNIVGSCLGTGELREFKYTLNVDESKSCVLDEHYSVLCSFEDVFFFF